MIMEGDDLLDMRSECAWLKGRGKLSICYWLADSIGSSINQRELADARAHI